MARRDVTLTRIKPLSAFRVGLAMSLVGLVAWLLAVCLVYFGAAQVGIWDQLNGLIGDVGGTQVVSFGLVLSMAALMGAIVAILTAILAPLMAVIYNAIVELFGGLTVRLADRQD